jgi:AcrR family transcriptional regulator
LTNLISKYILTNMTHEKKGSGQRRTAEERRAQILEAAISEFAARGLRGASVEDLAASVGVSQPYVYRLFGTKRDLFLAATGRVCDRVQEAFRQAAETDPKNALEEMGRSYNLSRFRHEDMLMLLQGFAAADDPEVREAVGERYAGLWRFVQDASGASEEEVWHFFATGMLLTVDAAIGLMPRLGKNAWPKEFTQGRDEEKTFNDVCDARSIASREPPSANEVPLATNPEV